MKKLLTLFPILFLIMSLVVSVASAHVEVEPNQVLQGSEQVFTIQVPVEKDMPTTKVQVAVPDKVEIESIQPVPGWTYTIGKDADGKITNITWAAVGKGLQPGEFEEFNITGTAEKGAKTLRWKAYQTYQDGSVVKWIGPEDSEHPAPVTKVTAAATDNGAAATTQNSSLPLYLSIAAAVLSVIALVLSLIKRK
jgi:uncharacterized protein YcnI